MTKDSQIPVLRAAHELIAHRVAPIYTVDELQAVSVTLAKGRGSCSQRLACVEAIARAVGIPTRVRALWIAGRFWYPRFQLSRPFIPREILLAWPQFYVNHGWVRADEIYGDLNVRAQRAPEGFSNSGETLFEALARTAVDFDGLTSRQLPGCSSTNCDLSRFVVRDEGLFDSRDDLFETLGSFQLSCRGRAFEMIFGDRKSA